MDATVMMTPMCRRAITGLLIVVCGTIGCSSSRPPSERDAGVDSGTPRDAGLDAAADAGRRCAFAGITLPDGRPVPTCRRFGDDCTDGELWPMGQAVCQVGICCAGVVDPETCECRCGEGPGCLQQTCCRPSPELFPDLDPDVPTCLFSGQCERGF